MTVPPALPATTPTTGVGGSAGVATGRAGVVGGVDQFGKLRRGDVLVCRSTDPAWTPLLTVASAVVTEVGGVLSHAAIVARELGIPAVLGVDGATVLFADGDRLVVDGTRGTVVPAV
ncbi:PEP-utilizing enzyme [Cellulomonas chitinilytica]|uniref:PEP-utilizing enzyme n=1 Tax=Cellulomonas chitinilytica TaxID=398759 RepID=UPI001EF1AE92|nr:PEP-utilizing enzyme [Cellulomonas chitinilytica]